MTGAEHPLIPSHRANTCTHLICKSLESQTAVSSRKRTGNAAMRTARMLDGQKALYCLFEAAMQKIIISRKGNEPSRGKAFFHRHMKAMNAVEKKKGPYLFVKIL